MCYEYILSQTTIHFKQKAKELLGVQAALLLFLFFKRRENEKVRVVLVVVCLYDTTFFYKFQFANYTKIIKTQWHFCAFLPIVFF
jgi:hypothetical protein